MNSDEKKILHGIYFYRKQVGLVQNFSACELAWLKRAKISDGKEWERDGRLQEIEIESEKRLAAKGYVSAEAQGPIGYLVDKGFIDAEIESGLIRIKVTAKGADMARELDTRYGRANLFFKENKDGITWVLVTALVSVATTLLTDLILKNV